LCGWWLSDALGNRVTSQESQQTLGCNQGAIPTQTYYYQAQTGRLMADSAHAPHPPWGRYDYFVDSLNNPLYDSSGNQFGNFSVTSQVNQAAVTQWQTGTSYYGADEKLRVVDQRKCFPNTNGQPSPCLPPTNTNPPQAGPFDEYRYDAFGRRIFTRSRIDTVAPATSTNVGTASQYARSTIERDVWDGNQLLVELRVPGSDTTTNLELDTNAVFAPFVNFGRVLYIHARGIDHPIDIVRTNYAFLQTGPDAGDTIFNAWLGATAIIPHWSWRNGLDDGSYADGSEIGDPLSPGLNGGHCYHYQLVPPPNGISCMGFAFPDGIEGMFSDMNKGVSIFGPPSWMGSIGNGSQDQTGQQFMRNRFYDPNSGRFTQEDPLGLAGGLNAYGFLNGDPVSYSDPFGLWPCPPDNDCGISASQAAAVFNQLASSRQAMNHAVAAFAGGTVVAGAAVGLAGPSVVSAGTTFLLKHGPVIAAIGAALAGGAAPSDEQLPSVRPPIPPGMTQAEFGSKVMQWGKGSADALERIPELTAQELQQAGVTFDMALKWAKFYFRVARVTPNNPSAAGRAQLMWAAAGLLEQQK
jgi:RHS repeat-associated protein